MRNFRTILLFFLFAIIFLPLSFDKTEIVQETAANAGFAQDWLEKKTGSSAQTYSDDKRQYFSAGSFSGRWTQKDESLITVSPPHLKFGCGGIDAFMGGLGFLNMKYIGKKLQRILQGAPVMAFDLALKALCQPCSDIMTKMNSIADKLNSISLDDCKSSTLLSAQIVSSANGFGSDKLLTEANARVNTLEGEKDTYQGVVETLSSVKKDASDWVFGETGKDGNTSTPKGGTTDKSGVELLKGCDATFKKIFAGIDDSANTDSGNNTTFLNQTAKFAASRGNTDSRYSNERMNLIRSMIGDVKINWTKNSTNDKYNLSFSPIAKCNNTSIIKSLIDGKLLNGTWDSSSGKTKCDDFTATSTDASKSKLEQFKIGEYVNSNLSSIFSKIQSGAALSDDEKAFTSSLPLPIMSALTLSAKMDGTTGAATLQMLQNITSIAYAYGMIADLTYEAYKFFAILQDYVSKGAMEADNCSVTIITPGLNLMNETLGGNLAKLSTDLMHEFAALAAEMNQINQLMDRFRLFDKIINQETARFLTQGNINRR